MTVTLTREAVQVDAKAFAGAVSWAAKAVPSHPTIPILGGLLLDAHDGELTVSGFDYDTMASATVATESGADGRWLVSGRLLDAVASTFGAKPVNINKEGSELVLRSRSTIVTLPTMPVEDYPTLPKAPRVIGTVNAETFAASVKRVARATGGYATPVMLTGFSLRFVGDQIALTASDKYRCAIDRIGWASAAPNTTISVLITSDLLAKTVPPLASGGGNISVLHADGLLGLSGGGQRLIARLMEVDTPSGGYPDMDRVLAKSGEHPAIVAVADLMEPVKRAMVVAPKTAVRMTFDRDEITVGTIGDEGEGRTSQLTPCTYGGKPIVVTTNAQYLLDAIDACGTTEVALSFTVPNRPYVVTPVNGSKTYRHVVMPIRT